MRKLLGGNILLKSGQPNALGVEVGKQSAEDKTGCDECSAAFYRHIITDPTCQACDSCAEKEYNPACGGSIKGVRSPALHVRQFSKDANHVPESAPACLVMNALQTGSAWRAQQAVPKREWQSCVYPCAAGEYAPYAATECSLCREGSYNPQEQASQCIACGDGQTTNERGAVSKDSCLCAAGYLHGISQNFTWEVTEGSDSYDMIRSELHVNDFESCSRVCLEHGKICSDNFVQNLYSLIDSDESPTWQAMQTRLGQLPFDKETDYLYPKSYGFNDKDCYLFPYIEKIESEFLKMPFGCIYINMFKEKNTKTKCVQITNLIHMKMLHSL